MRCCRRPRAGRCTGAHGTSLAGEGDQETVPARCAVGSWERPQRAASSLSSRASRVAGACCRHRVAAQVSAVEREFFTLFPCLRLAKSRLVRDWPGSPGMSANMTIRRSAMLSATHVRAAGDGRTGRSRRGSASLNVHRVLVTLAWEIRKGDALGLRRSSAPASSGDRPTPSSWDGRSGGRPKQRSHLPSRTKALRPRKTLSFVQRQPAHEPSIAAQRPQ